MALTLSRPVGYEGRKGHNMTNTEKTLFGVERAAIRAAATYRYWVYDAIAWYITTGRASMGFIEALSRVNPDKLVERLGADGDSTEGYVDKVKRYLRMYGKLAD